MYKLNLVQRQLTGTKHIRMQTVTGYLLIALLASEWCDIGGLKAKNQHIESSYKEVRSISKKLPLY